MFNAKIVKTYPPEGGLQLYRVESATSFICSRCHERKTSKIIATNNNDADQLLCNGCYGRLRSGVVSADEAAAPQGAAPQRRPADVRRDQPDGGNVARFKAEEPQGGAPYDINHTGKAVEWKMTVRAEHITGRILPVPEEMTRRLPQRALHVRFWLGGARSRSLWPPHDVHPELQREPTALVDFDWPRPVLPGSRVSVRWDLWTNLRLLFAPLRKPRVVDGLFVRFDYDPRVMTRDVAPSHGRLDQVEEAVLLTLRELGYLDEVGRAFLPDEDLVRDTGERSKPNPPPPGKVRAAIQRLVSAGDLVKDMGSLGSGGILRYPARNGESTVPLLCYVPAMRPARQEDFEAAVGVSARDVSMHRVAGHLMRIGHLDKEASAEAKAAYRRDHTLAGLAGTHDLPPGHTYVREHRRGL
ncbi:hypothetical protein ACIG8K_11280 [Streptomyces halstedii]|uniref:hypothetical protein n=1 Tax=Streptomyces halstedii TaxID=1944 RepID=UPI0037D6A4A0